MEAEVHHWGLSPSMATRRNTGSHTGPVAFEDEICFGDELYLLRNRARRWGWTNTSNFDLRGPEWWQPAHNKDRAAAVVCIIACSVTRPLNNILGTNNSFTLLDACYSH